ncbi:HDIG domain-containing protein [Candidatus Woesearchaeota archaeon]|nr:HDIG domain-containing protein [Candidatus Woesearchaeota archaeon]
METSRTPSEKECLELMAEMNLAPALMNHSIMVGRFASEMADKLNDRGIPVDKQLLVSAALLHDIRKMDAEVCHGMEGGEFLRRRGFHEVASVVEKHCLSNLDEPSLVPKTTEEKLLMYSDLRVSTGKIVSLDERFAYIRKRYKPKDPKKFQEYMAFAKQLEWELFGKINGDAAEDKEM